MAGPELGQWRRKGDLRREGEGELIELGDRELRRKNNLSKQQGSPCC